nr:hypothetical protein [Mammaliicoccus sp. Marseille-Q6498]
MNVSIVSGGSVELINYLHNRKIKFILVLSNDDYYDYKYIKSAVECYILDFKKLNKLREIIKIISNSYDVDGIISWDDNTIEISSILGITEKLKDPTTFIEYGYKFPMNVEKENYELIQEKVKNF